jgi:hypothetical protein
MIRSISALTLLSLAWLAAPAVRAQTPSPLASLEITGPYAHQNLAVFLVRDRQAAEHAEMLTLEEALKTKAVVVKETSQVNQLVASNRGKRSVYIQAGDIVKGGKQDRVLGQDTVLPPGAKNVPLNSFCVEQGRWQGRGRESARHFGSSRSALVTKKQKLAVKLAKNQGEVWAAVAEAQAELGGKLGQPVAARESRTSLQLSLENAALQQSVDDYVKAVERQVPSAKDGVGYAIAVNGKVESVDIFASPKLFGKMKRKLLTSGATEAVAEKGAGPVATPGREAVMALLTDAETGEAKPEQRSGRTKIGSKESRKGVVFTAEDPLSPRKAVHKNYLAK